MVEETEEDLLLPAWLELVGAGTYTFTLHQLLFVVLNHT